MFSVKDIRKLVVVSIIGACAVFVANLFLNFYLDIEQLEISKTNPMMQTYYDAQVSLVLDVDPSHVFLYQTICRRPQGTIRNFKGFGL